MASPVVFFRRPAPVPTSDLHSDSDDDAAFPSFTRFPTASPATSDDEDSTPAYKHDNIPAPLNASRIMIHLGDLANLQHQIGIPGIGGLNNILGNQPPCSCGNCGPCMSRSERRRQRRAARGSLRDLSIKNRSAGPIGPTADYLRRIAVPSKPVAGGRPLVVLSLDHVLCCMLPRHLSGGHTDVLARGYLTTLMSYLLDPKSKWCLCFFTAMKRKKALKVLASLKLPTGGPEADERDGVVGIFARDDMRAGWNGGEVEVKDLEVMWSELEKEEGIRWSPETTVVLTDNPQHMIAQPSNFILLPSFIYKTNIAAADDQNLLMMITCLKDLETETNFAYHIKAMKWDKVEFWSLPLAKYIATRDSYVHSAVRICANERISITAFTGN